jgi:hypothetical protein
MAALLSACQKDNGQATQTSNVPHHKTQATNKGPTVEELTAGMVQAVAQGKSPLEIEVKFELPTKPKVGEGMEVNLAVIPQFSGGPLALQVAGAGFTTAEAPYALSEVQPGEVYRHTVKVTPTGEGVLLLGVTVSVRRDETSDTKSFAIPVLVDR